MISYSDVKKRSRRENYNENASLMFFSTKVSMPFTWLFVNLGLSANQVTLLFYITGFIGCVVLLLPESYYVLLSYALYRLHIIFDVCDGEVARFRQQFSLNGLYWDYMIHAHLFPLYSAFLSIRLYILYDSPIFLILGTQLIIGSSLVQAVKNNYYRALYAKGIQHPKPKNKDDKRSSIAFKLFNFSSLIASFEGFFVFFLLLSIFPHPFLYICWMISYVILFYAVVVGKLCLFSSRGHSISRN